MLELQSKFKTIKSMLDKQLEKFSIISTMEQFKITLLQLQRFKMDNL